MQGPFSCGMWDLVCQPGTEPERLVSVGVWNLSQRTSREVPLAGFLDVTWPLLWTFFLDSAAHHSNCHTVYWSLHGHPHPLTHSPRGSFLWTFQKSLLSTGREYLEASQMNSQLSPAHSPAVTLGNSFLLSGPQGPHLEH